MNELSQSVFENLYNFEFQDFLDQLKADKERKKALWKVDIELRRQSEEGLEQQEREQSQSLENVVVLDDNIVPVEFKNELPTVQNICLNL